jgi:hypothetical protein
VRRVRLLDQDVSCFGFEFNWFLPISAGIWSRSPPWTSWSSRNRAASLQNARPWPGPTTATPSLLAIQITRSESGWVSFRTNLGRSFKIQLFLVCQWLLHICYSWRKSWWQLTKHEANIESNLKNFNSPKITFINAGFRPCPTGSNAKNWVTTRELTRNSVVLLLYYFVKCTRYGSYRWREICWIMLLIGEVGADNKLCTFVSSCDGILCNFEV